MFSAKPFKLLGNGCVREICGHFLQLIVALAFHKPDCKNSMHFMKTFAALSYYQEINVPATCSLFFSVNFVCGIVKMCKK